MNEPIRILHVFGRLDRGGAETMIMNILRNIDRVKFKFDFVIHSNDECDYSPEIRELGGRIFSIPKYNVKNHALYVEKWNNFFEVNNNYKIVHGHVRSTASIYLKIARKHKLVTIAHSHNTSSGKGISAIVKNMLQKRITKHADYLLSCSTEAGEWLFGKKAINRNNHFIMPNAIDMSKFSLNKETRDCVRTQYKIDDKIVVGTIGRLVDQKNPFFIVEIIKELVLINKDYAFLWIGNGELYNQIDKKLKNYGLSEHVIFTGSISNTNEMIMSMDLFLLPSKWEGLGIVIVEAQASNLVCVVSNEIPDEVIYTNIVHKISLKLNEKKWAEKIDYLIKQTPRYKSADKKKNPYDIKDSVIWTQNFYKEIAK